MPEKTFAVNFKTKGFRRAKSQMDDVGDEADEAGSSVANAGEVAKKGLAAMTAAITAAVAGLGTLITKSAQYADSIDKAAERTGVGRQEIQRLKFAAEQSGASLEAIESTASSFARRIARVEDGTGQASDAFDQLGVSLRDSSGELRNQGDIYNDVLGSLAEMDNATRRASVGSQLFGRQFSELQPLLNQGADGIDELRAQADELGIVMGEENVRSFTALKDEFTAFTSRLSAIGREIAVRFLPVMRDLIIPALDAMAEATQSAFADVDTSALTDSIRTTITVFGNLWDATKAFLGQIQDFTRSVLSDLAAVWEDWGAFITEIGRLAFSTLGSFIEGFAGAVTGIWNTLVGVLAGNWERAFRGIKQFTVNTVSTIAESVLGFFQTVIMGARRMAQAVGMDGIGSALQSAEQTLESWKQSVDVTQDSVNGFTADLQSMNDTFAGLGGGSFGGGGAGGLFEVNEEGQGGGGGASGSGQGGNQGQGGGGGPQIMFDQLISTADRLIQKQAQTQGSISRTQQAAQRFTNTLGRGIGRTIGQLVTFQGQVSGLGELFQSVGNTIQQALSQVISKLASAVAQAAALRGIMAAFGIGSIGGASTFGSLLGNVIGLDSGGTILSDGIAKVHKGEAVVNRQIMQNIGQQTQPRSGGTLTTRISMDELIFQLDRSLKSKGQTGIL